MNSYGCCSVSCLTTWGLTCFSSLRWDLDWGNDRNPDTLWLCQNSYGKWPLNSWNFPLKMVIFHSYVSLPEGDDSNDNNPDNDIEHISQSWCLIMKISQNLMMIDMILVYQTGSSEIKVDRTSGSQACLGTNFTWHGWSVVNLCVEPAKKEGLVTEKNHTNLVIQSVNPKFMKYCHWPLTICKILQELYKFTSIEQENHQTQ